MNAEEKLDVIRKILTDEDLCAEAMVTEIGEILNDDDTVRVVPSKDYQSK